MATTRRKPSGGNHKLHVVGDAETHQAEAEAPAMDHNAVDRAEQVVDHLSERVSHWSSTLSHTVARTSARIAEELEDFWAEAKALSRARK